MISYRESTHKTGSRLRHDSISNLFEDQNTWQVLNVTRFLFPLTSPIFGVTWLLFLEKACFSWCKRVGRNVLIAFLYVKEMLVLFIGALQSEHTVITT